MIGIYIKNTLLTIITRILQLIFAIVTSIIIARVLGPEKKGIYTLAMLLPLLLINFTNLGIGPANVYYIGKRKYNINNIFGINIIFAIIISLFTVIIGIFIIYFFSMNLFPRVEKNYLYLALLIIPFNLFVSYTVNIFLGMQKIKKYNYVNLLQKILFLALIIFLFIWLKCEVELALWANILSYALISIILFYNFKKELGKIIFETKKELLKNYFQYGIIINLTNILSFLHLRIDSFMLNLFLNPAAVGFYSISVALAEKLWIISQSAGTILFPKVSSENDNIKIKNFTPIVCRNILMFSIIGSIALLFFGAKIIVLLYSKEYSASISSFKILLIGIIAISGASILSNDLSGRGKLRENMYINIFSIILNIILNVILIPKFEIEGAAWATSVSYSLTFFMRLLVYSRTSGNNLKDIIFIQKSDFVLYKNLVYSLIGKK